MVKPPKTMQPEAVNLKKAGRDTNKAFGEDSFVNYMARKIDLQRKQFGLVLPPRPPSPASASAIALDNPKKATKVETGGDDGTPGTRMEKAAISGGSSKKKPIPKKRKRFGISGIVKRLKKKHGEQSLRPVLSLEDGADEPATEESSSTDNVTAELPSNAVLDVSQASYGTTTANEELRTKQAGNSSLKPQEDHGSSQNDARRTDLFFLGVVVLINGYTKPDAETLQRMLHKHGGDVEKYETSRVTHIIAEQLSTAKATMYKRQKRPRPVCKPSWITESVEKGRKLPCAEYLLDEVRKESIGATKSVSSFYSKKDKSPNATPIKNNVNILTSPVEKTEYAENPLQFQRQKDRFINGKVRTVGNDPDFLDSFFRSSRLSFIGSYKQRAGQSPTKSVTVCQQDEDSTKYVLHVDMDCFFASVVLRKFPEYRDKPVAISHHGLRKGGETMNRSVPPENSSSECATCNYVARQFGIKKGMFLGRAKELCPSLIVLHYDFEGYEEVSEAVYEILVRFTSPFSGFIEQVSCDESYVEVFIPKISDTSSQIVSTLAETIRKEIFEVTQCTATIGIADNKLMSKLAADYAKPNRSFVVTDPKSLLGRLDLHQLPGIGFQLRRKLESNKFVTVKDVWNRGSRAQDELCAIVGKVNGKKLYGYCQGIDNRDLQQSIRKTIGAECSYGVRFDGPYGSDHMLRGLCEEVEKRMISVGVKCTKLTLKVKQRKPGAPPPPKFLGHGSCFNHSKSGRIAEGATRLASKLFETAMPLMASMGICDKDIRGIGVVASGLATDEDCREPDNKPDEEKLKIAKLFDAYRQRSSPACAKELEQRPTAAAHNELRHEKLPKQLSFKNKEKSLILPPSSQIHMSQVDKLPSPIRREVASQMRNTRKKSRTSVAPAGVQSYRQINVQRMLRLAEVKSCPGNVSLTQLECLPFELQLQIANDDELDISCKPSGIERRKIVLHSPGKQEEVPIVRLSPRQNDAFEREMARPFSDFMDQNSALIEANVNKIADFLLTCVSEGRFVDVVVLLRQLQNRSDSWKERYQNVFETINASVKHYTGATLDHS